VIRLEDLDYDLPPDRIAQSPVRPRDSARLLVLDRATGAIEEARFRDLPERIGPDDVVVVNDTRVLRARLRGSKESGGRAEALLLERHSDGMWSALVRVRGRLRRGLRLELGGHRAEIAEVLEDGRCRLRFEGAADPSALERSGEAPLPPYIRRPRPLEADLGDYQSVFARAPGAVAAPTASLHFTAELAARMRIAFVTLHVGPGSFRPIRAKRLDEHALEPEWFRVPPETSTALAAAGERGGRAIAVGTTVVRALETTRGRAGEGRTDLFISPGFPFRVVDSLVTNFHLPRSSLLALVMAFGGVEPVRRAYAHAIEKGFRFYSYGDAMWIR
jgi:S-adenosylmethionine:tRNA ribosyltransferase-isomerase